MSKHIWGFWAGAALLAALSGCAATGQKAAAPVTYQFAPDWSEHSKSLFNQGPGVSAGTTSWWVPTILPRGTYRVIQRVDGKPQVVDGYRFEIDGNVNKEIHLMLPAAYSNVEALDEKYIIDVKPGTQ
ncbi:hypothetical protein [Undibacterium terreum]|uniref:Lipoprotein n=1 Tax=Undibacterium terreum TaxID=1224302 RepID=A0A916UC19_9BURK|nr:hypothetical protein [Undibacterium terreum]GGC67521.1 hypothetical protein GCM10011396_13170 [Undibacterium terreum]